MLLNHDQSENSDAEDLNKQHSLLAADLMIPSSLKGIVVLEARQPRDFQERKTGCINVSWCLDSEFRDVNVVKRLLFFLRKHSISRSVVILFSKGLYLALTPLFRLSLRLIMNPKANRLVFVSSPDFSDNSRALFDYLVGNGYGKKYEMIWLVDNPLEFSDKKIENVRFIKGRGRLHGYLTFKSLYHAQNARVVFYTHTFPRLMKKGSLPLKVNLWHGCGYKDSQVSDKRRKADFDCVLVPGPLFIDVKSSFFGCEREKVLALGYPRYDKLYEKSGHVDEFVQMFRRSKEEKLIVWMPTFRKSHSYFPENVIRNDYNVPVLSSDEQLHELDRFCIEKQVVLLIKRHQNEVVDERNLRLTSIHFIENDTLEEFGVQLYEVLGRTDGLITDYSSVAFDYLLLDRPIAFTLHDFEEYGNTRGFVFAEPRDYMPGHHVYSFKELCDFISDVSVGKDEYREKRETVRSQAHTSTSNYCETIARYFELVG